MTKPTITFWYEFASTYSYPAAMRIGALADKAGVTVHWQPLLLGPIFASTGMNTSPFNTNPVKGRYMWRDMQRLCADLGLPLVQPDPFPANSLLAARVATGLADQGERVRFSQAIYRAEFADGRAIGVRDVVASCLEAAGILAQPALEAASSDAVKAALRASVEKAMAMGIFGAPTVTTADGEMFWGNDRIETALAWAGTAR